MSPTGQVTAKDIEKQTREREFAMGAASMAGSLGKVGKAMPKLASKLAELAEEAPKVAKAAESSAVKLAEKGVVINGNRYKTLKEAINDGITESQYTNAKQASYRPAKENNFGSVIDLTRPEGKLPTDKLIAAVKDEGKVVGNNVYPTLKDAAEDSVPAALYDKAKQSTYKELEVPVEAVVPQRKFSNLEKLIRKERTQDLSQKIDDLTSPENIDKVMQEARLNQLNRLQKQPYVNTALDDTVKIDNLEKLRNQK
jgi:hypothetical protein